MTGKVLGMQFAPINVPLHRRVQMAAVIAYIFVLWSMPVSLVLGYLCVRHGLWWLPVLYLSYILYDRDTPKRGGRALQCARQWSLWQHLRDYFPMSLEKTADLDPTKNYLFGYHPHGILVTGLAGNISLNTVALRRLYPGLSWRVCTLNFFFYMPLMRDLLLSLGGVSVSRESIRHVLTKCGAGGNALVIVVGGAQEAFDATPGNSVLRLKDRLGFVKIAIQTGANLVPIYSFGENDLFTLVEAHKDSCWKKCQDLIKRLTTLPPLVFFGRGIFNYSFGGLPHRRPIHTILGEPIPVTQKAEPTPEEVAQLHATYVAALTSLFDRHKVKHGHAETAQLVIY